MVKLNEDAFAAVNAAFPEAAAKEASTKPTTNKPAVTGAKRKGVGASAAESSTFGTSDIIHKRVLQIGSKKRKKLGEDDEEEGEESYQGGVGRKFDDRKRPPTNIDQDSDEDGDEEDLGRTAINKEAKRVAAPPSLDQLLPEPGKNKKKKKLGKKEREAEKGSKDQEVAKSASKPAKKDVLCGTVDPKDETKDTKKRKRPKVRSRQKNIRKDNRSNKPSHLIPGNGDYRGRPLTAETRKKLNMSESRRETKLKAYWSNQNKSSGEGSGEANA